MPIIKELNFNEDFSQTDQEYAVYRNADKCYMFSDLISVYSKLNEIPISLRKACTLSYSISKESKVILQNFLLIDGDNTTEALQLIIVILQALVLIQNHDQEVY